LKRNLDWFAALSEADRVGGSQIKGAATMDYLAEERNVEQNVQDIMVMGYTEDEARSLDSTERKALAATSRKLQRQASEQKPRAFAATA
jgi:hypothetical protein